MSWMKTIVGELISLFVDDGTFAGAIAVWLGLTWFALPHLAIPRVFQAPILFAGLLAILTESVVRSARRP